MTSIRLLPYRTIEEGDLAWESWWFERDGLRQPLPTLLHGWDYAREEIIGNTVDVDGEAVKRSTGLPDLSSLDLVLTADCSSLGRRFLSRESLSGDPQQRIELSLRIPAGEAAAKLDMSVHLVVREPFAPASRTACVAGARLGSSQRRSLFLEGESSRFPTEAVTFSSVGLEEAPWTLSTSFVELSDSFMGSVRLVVNEAHPLGQRVLSADPDPESATRLKIDVFRMLVAITCDHALEWTPDISEESVGAVVSHMSELYLRRSLVETTTLYRDDPVKFERLCYQAVSE